MKSLKSRLTILSVVSVLVLFGFSANGFFSVVSGDRWYPTNSDGSVVRCHVQRTEVEGRVRNYAALCDGDRFFMATINGGVDWKKEITKDEFRRRARLAQSMGEGWSHNISLDDPRVQGLLKQ